MASADYMPGFPGTDMSFDDIPRRKNNDAATTNNNNNIEKRDDSLPTRDSKGSKENELNKKETDKIAFVKSQAALNAAYKQRREKYLQTPLAARMETGKNLKNFQPLAVRTAEFC